MDALTTDSGILDSAFLGAVTPQEHERSWTVDLDLNGKKIQFKLDTGAEVTAISEESLGKLKNISLRKPAKSLYGPTCNALEVIGQFVATLKTDERVSKQSIFVVRGLKSNLLGLPAITALQLINWISATQIDGASIEKKYPELFSGLGNLGEPYVIKMKKDAVPYSLFTPRNVPLPLRGKVQEELLQMEAAGVMSKVDQPSPWCAGIVVVPKNTGAVSICVDLKPLNESVLREAHPMPRVDETLALLTGAKIFSKLDANSGFWKIPLAEESRLLTTFITPYGRFCFNKLPFGISSAPELFQKRMTKILDGLNGVVCLIDDVLIFGSTQTEHDSRLMAVMERIKAANVTLNPKKCEFSKPQVKFLGHLIDANGIQADPEKTAAISSMKPPCNITELRRFLGMANQLGKFSPHLAEYSQPLRELLHSKRVWVWGPEQEQAFQTIKH